jgi:hypothetical protein
MTGRSCGSSWMFLCIFLIKQCRLQEHSKRSSSMANKSNNFCFEHSNRVTVWAYLYPENRIAIQRQPSNVSACNWHSTGRIPVVAAAAEVSAVAQLAKLKPWALRLRPQQPLLPSLSTMSKRFFPLPKHPLFTYTLDLLFRSSLPCRTTSSTHLARVQIKSLVYCFEYFLTLPPCKPVSSGDLIMRHIKPATSPPCSTTPPIANYPANSPLSSLPTMNYPADSRIPVFLSSVVRNYYGT